jgi:hypothetical protein
MHLWFIDDPDGDGATRFETEAEAREAFTLAVKTARDIWQDENEMPERFGEICMGRVTAVADPDTGFGREVQT